jgi:hypothetical protein
VTGVVAIAIVALLALIVVNIAGVQRELERHRELYEQDRDR